MAKLTKEKIAKGFAKYYKEQWEIIKTFTTVKQLKTVDTDDLLKLRSWIFKFEKPKNDADEPRPMMIQKIIIDRIKRDPNCMEVDQIIEIMTRFGADPQLVYNDNGQFAVSESATQTGPVGADKFTGYINVPVKKNMWKKNIREALNHYILRH